LTGSERGTQRRRPRHPATPRPGVGVLVLVVVALVPLLVATWEFGRTYHTSELGQVDARLAATAGAVAAAVRATEVRTSHVTASLAQMPELQRVLARGRSQELTLARPRGVHVLARPGAASVSVPPASVSRTAIVVQGERLLGHVTAWVGLRDLLAQIARKAGIEAYPAVAGHLLGGRLRGAPLAGPAGAPYATRLGGSRYRVLRQPLSGDVSAVLLVPYSKIEGTVFHRELPTAAAGAVTLLALGLLAALAWPRLLLLRSRSTGGDWRTPVALVGDVAVAAHDPEALLPVILETALVATGARGGTVVWEGKEIASIGTVADVRRALVLTLGDESSPGAGQLILYRGRRDFSAHDREVAESLVAQGRIALENARLHRVVRRQAQTDELTDLANRRRFINVLQQEIARSLRFDSSLTLVLFDLDRFKRINDRCGHQVGDLVLRRTADAVRVRIRETDIAARVGGEEFAILLPGTDLSGGATFADNLRRDIECQVTVEGVKWPTTASFGVAEFRAGMSIEELMGAADHALYRAKAAGRNAVHIAEEAASSGADA
jgi:diguanylate cyclase (GGDEF)-like protein